MESKLTRRSLLISGAALGGGLMLGLRLPVTPAEAGAASFVPNAFVRLDADGTVILTMPYVEMGQGTYTSVSMLIAEELEVGLDQVRVEHAPPDPVYGNPLLAGLQATGGSTTIRSSWMPLRQAGAAAREMLIAAAAARWGVAAQECRAERGVVIHDRSGRHLSYGELAAEASAMPVPQDPMLKQPGQFRLIGTPAKRIDTPAKVDGTAVFGIDARPPGVKIATLAQSPVFGGRLKSLDDGAASAIKGVRQIVRLDDAVAVVADHFWAAKKALDALVVEWDDGPDAEVSDDALLADLEQALQQPGAVAQDVGNADAALQVGAKRIDSMYHVPFLAHATMEPMNCTVHVRPESCDVWVGTQVIGRAQEAAAKVTGLPLDKVTVHNHLLGGGFGRRLEVDGITRAVQIATHVEGPVKVIWTREEDIRHDMYRPIFMDRLSAALDADGNPVAWSNRFAGSSILARFLPPAFNNGLDPDTTDGAIDLVYDLPNFHVEYSRVEPRHVPTAFWRSVGPSHNVFVTESFMDELAFAASQDPVSYRAALLAKSPRAKAVLERAAEAAGWGTPLGPRQGRGVSLQSSFGSFMAMVAEVEVAADGSVRVRRVTCALDCGIVVNPDTVRAQVEGATIFGISAVLYGRISIKDGRVQQSNFDSYPTLRMDEVPEIDVQIIDSQEAPGGLGEPGTSAIVPAVANAIFSATGTRIRSLPNDGS